MINDLLLLMQFFTRIPINKELEYDEVKYAKSIWFLPLVALIMGFILYIVYNLLNYLNIAKNLIALILLLTNILLTGALHLDGLADSFDGLFSYRDKERTLEIMKDSNTGVNGVIGLFLVFLTKFVTYGLIGIVPIILSLISARLNLIFQSYALKYAREKGMGLSLFNHVGKLEVIKATLITLLIFLIDYRYISILILNLIFQFWINKQLNKKIGGGTGDTLGMTIELSECAFLILALILFRG